MEDLYQTVGIPVSKPIITSVHHLGRGITEDVISIPGPEQQHRLLAPPRREAKQVKTRGIGQSPISEPLKEALLAPDKDI